jgi:hypothetical protein
MAEKSQSEKKPENRRHTGGGEQNRRPLRSDDPSIEKNPVRDRDGRTAQDRSKPVQETAFDETCVRWVLGGEGCSVVSR